MKPNRKAGFLLFPSLQEMLEIRMQALEKNLAETPQSLDCPFCKGAVDKDLIICPHCLKDLKVNCPFCGELVPSGSTFCGWCGSNLR